MPRSDLPDGSKGVIAQTALGLSKCCSTFLRSPLGVIILLPFPTLGDHRSGIVLLAIAQ